MWHSNDESDTSGECFPDVLVWWREVFRGADDYRKVNGNGFVDERHWNL